MLVGNQGKGVKPSSISSGQNNGFHMKDIIHSFGYFSIIWYIAEMNSDKSTDRSKTIILGGGITGLSAGYVSGLTVYEARETAGGICTSYYMKKGDKKRSFESPTDDESYHFEIGGGHWVFGGDPIIKRFINALSPFKKYSRKAGVYLPDQKIMVPYPIQNNLHSLDKKIANEALHQLLEQKTDSKIETFEHWLKASFGETLCNLFFYPFHDLYTAKLYKQIIPQDPHKSPINKEEIVAGFHGKASTNVGYNPTFIYPEKGLDNLVRKLAERCDIRYDKKVTKIDSKNKSIDFADGTRMLYENIISTLPLNIMAKLANIDVGEKPSPSPSVLVFNIGAIKGSQCPEEHWIYIPKSRSGFHRVGFYSNVDTMFLPKSHRKNNDRVSIYVEKAYPENSKPEDNDIRKLGEEIIKELQDLNWIKEVEVCDPTWIETAYTWSWPNSTWKEKTLKSLENAGIYQTGRYGRWEFYGIADSIRDGLIAGGAFS